MPMAVLRFLVLWLFLVWQGGFFVYAAIVVPIGTDVLESARLQGAVTQRVTHWLNGFGIAALLAIAFLDLLTMTVRANRARWFCWLIMAVAHLMQLHLRTILDRDFDPTTLSIADRPHFRYWHGVYLWAAAIQWAVGLLWLALTIRAWTRREAA